MPENPIVTGPEAGKKKGTPKDDPYGAWSVAGWVGLAFLIVGGIDFALVWFPLNLGNPEWAFGTVTASFNGLPIVVLGLGLLLIGSAQGGVRWWGLLAGLASVFLILWIIGGALIWVANVPLALETTPVEVLTGLKKAVTKTGVQVVVYVSLLSFLSLKALKAVRGN